MIKLKFLNLLIFSLLFYSCSLFEEEEPPVDISFDSDFTTTQFSGSFTLDGQTVPLTGAYFSVTKNSTIQNILINLAPPNSSGSDIFPGDGWVQFRFNVDVENGTVSAVPNESTGTVYDADPLDLKSFNSNYIGTDGNIYEIQNGGTGRVTSNSLEIDEDGNYEFDFSFESQATWVMTGSSSQRINAKQMSGSLSFSVGASSNAGGNSIVGTWQYQQSNCGTLKAEMKFGSNGKGSVYLPDCNQTGSCPTGQVTDFNYTVTATQITFNYTKYTFCGQEGDVPAGGSVNYTLSSDGNSLTIGSQTWTRK